MSIIDQIRNREFRHPEFQTLQQLDSLDDIETSGIKIVRPIRERKIGGNHPRFVVSAIKIPSKNRWVGYPLKWRKDGTVIFSRIVIDGHRTFDLSKEQDAIEFHVVKHAEFMQGSELNLLSGRRPVYMVYDPVYEANKFLEDRKKGIEAESTISGMSDNEIRDFGLIYNISPSNTPVTVIRRMLIEKCIKTPEKIIDKLSDMERTSVLITLKRCLHTGLVKETLDKGYIYQDRIELGVTQEAAIEHLIREKVLLYEMEHKSKELSEMEGYKPIKALTSATNDEIKALRSIDKKQDKDDKLQNISELYTIVQKLTESIESINQKVNSIISKGNEISSDSGSTEGSNDNNSDSDENTPINFRDRMNKKKRH